jgi:3-oxoacyl-[acyl-carrier protein] reductase
MGILDGQVAIVTGCGRLKGLGRGIALALAREGAAVVVTDVRADGTRNPLEADEPEAAIGWKGLASLVHEISEMGGHALAAVGDVGVKEDAERTVSDAVERFGKVDILVNNAVAPKGPDRDWSWKLTEESWDLVMRINLKGTFLMSSAVVRHLLEREAHGRVVNIASMAGRVGNPRNAAYSASKFGVIGLTQSMALELAASGITVNAVCPGSMDTARHAVRNSDIATPPPVPVGRRGVPEDIARAVIFLADPAASFITGETMIVSGGIIG